MTDHPFYSHATHGFLRVAIAVPYMHLGQPQANADEIARIAREAHHEGVALLITPELSLSGYSLDDVLQQEIMLHSSLEALESLIDQTGSLDMAIAVGLPLASQSAMYNVAAMIAGGRCLGMVPKRYLPNYREYYEGRIFAPGHGVSHMVTVGGRAVPLADRHIFSIAGCRTAIEICEDAWVPVTPGMRDALAGAEVIANLSASNVTIHKAPARDDLVRHHSCQGRCAYMYVAAGYGESTTDMAWDGQGMVYELGTKVTELPRYHRSSHWRAVDIDIARIRRERRLVTVFDQNARNTDAGTHLESTASIKPSAHQGGLMRPLSRFPYVPDEQKERSRTCSEIYQIQIQGLLRRVEATQAQALVLGLSGGIDSSHALLIAHAVCQELGKPLSDVMVWYLTGPGSSQASCLRARNFCQALGIEFRRISIRPAVNRMLRDIGHPAASASDHAAIYDTTYENVQAGLRSDYLFRLANHHNGLVVGTGDLSELALGWCTFGIGDHMAHYNVNASLPKTLIQYVMRWVADREGMSGKIRVAAEAILKAGISPELLPGQDQNTEDTIGPYELNDFFLYHTLRNGFSPEKVAFLAYQSWGRGQDAKYQMEELLDRLAFFYKRFFASQYKRSTLPNATKISFGGSLSPRGDWRAPSDLPSDLWLGRVRDLKRALLPV